MRKVWIWASLFAAAALVAIAAIIVTFPRPTGPERRIGVDGATDIADAAQQESAITERPDGGPAGSGAEASNAGVPDAPALPPQPEPTAIAGDPGDGIAGPVPGGTLPAPIEPSAGLQADMIAFVIGLESELPRVGENISLDSVAVVGNQLHFVNTVQIDLADYRFAYDPAPLGPQLLGWSCDGSMCFEFTDLFARGPCSGEAAELIAEGAVAIYVYRDIRGRFMGQMAVTAADCELLAING